MPKIIENTFIKTFKNKESFSREEIFDFFRSFEPDLKETTLGWRIYNLKNKNIIKPLKRGLYVISYKPLYKPELSRDLLKIANRINEAFKEVRYCIWETSWLNEFSQHQSGKRMILVEIEKEFTESLYFELKKSSKREIFLKPDANTINFYIAESIYPIVIKKLTSRSPLTSRTKEKGRLYTPLLEKILVDLFADHKIFYHLQGSELIHVFEYAINHYAINYTKLFSYAMRRDKEPEIKQFMTNNLPHLIHHILE
jgi:hypothetical protein